MYLTIKNYKRIQSKYPFTVANIDETFAFYELKIRLDTSEYKIFKISRKLCGDGTCTIWRTAKSEKPQRPYITDRVSISVLENPDKLFNYVSNH